MLEHLFSTTRLSFVPELYTKCEWIGMTFFTLCACLGLYEHSHIHMCVNVWGRVGARRGHTTHVKDEVFLRKEEPFVTRVVCASLGEGSMRTSQNNPPSPSLL